MTKVAVSDYFIFAMIITKPGEPCSKFGWTCTHVVMHHMQRISLSDTMWSCWATLAISWLRWLVAVSSWPVALEACV